MPLVVTKENKEAACIENSVEAVKNTGTVKDPEALRPASSGFRRPCPRMIASAAGRVHPVEQPENTDTPFLFATGGPRPDGHGRCDERCSMQSEYTWPLVEIRPLRVKRQRLRGAEELVVES